LRRRDPSMLTAVDAPRSPALAGDRSLIADLTRAGVRPRGLHLVVITAHVISHDVRRMRVLVRDRRSAYDVVDGSGHVVAHRPARGRRSWVIALRRTPAGYRIARVTTTSPA
jgi:hypothetical protein